jgi:hypothetical protein
MMRTLFYNWKWSHKGEEIFRLQDNEIEYEKQVRWENTENPGRELQKSSFVMFFKIIFVFPVFHF